MVFTLITNLFSESCKVQLNVTTHFLTIYIKFIVNHIHLFNFFYKNKNLNYVKLLIIMKINAFVYLNELVVPGINNNVRIKKRYGGNFI